jgi:3-isopropylmalate/(R)-2-methylmalate dehydratase small subunit
MAYDKFEILKSTGVPLNIDNVDTDQIIPARFLKATERKGFGDNLFRDWRYNSDGTAIPSFSLNNPNYKGKILVAGKNFGCGSSREHAVWAIYDYGFRAVVSSFFADIFKNNCLNNDSESLFEVNLENQEFIIKELNKKEVFKISLYKKGNMSNGYDDIDYLLNKKEEISRFANKFIF